MCIEILLKRILVQLHVLSRIRRLFVANSQGLVGGGGGGGKGGESRAA